MSSGEMNPVISAAKALASVNQMLLEGRRDPETLLRYLQPVIGQPETYADVLNQPPRQADFIAGFEPELWVPEWERFHLEVYGLKVNLTPAFRQPTEHLDHVWPVFCDPRMGLNRIWAESRNLHPTHSYLGDDLEKVVTKNDRSAAANGLYMVRFRARVEADVEYKDLSANTLAKRGIQGITLDERLKLGQFVWWKTGGFHLDTVMVTLCAGSRYRGGDVPGVGWGGSQLCVYYYDPDGSRDYLRTRSAVL